MKPFRPLLLAALLLAGSLFVLAQQQLPPGTKLWEFNTGGIVQSSAAVAADGTVYLGSDSGRLFAFDPRGRLKWTFAAGGNVIGAPAFGADGTICFGSTDGHFHALKADGKVKWRVNTGSAIVSSVAVAVDGLVVFGSVSSNVFAVLPDGTLKWVHQTDASVISSPAIGADSTIYVGTMGGRLLALTPDGAKKWEFNAGEKINSSPAIGPDGTIYFGCFDGALYALRPDGKKQWAFETTGSIRSSPAVGPDGVIYFGSDDRRLYALNPDGTRKWAFATGYWIRSSPAVAADGTVYIGSYDNRLYALTRDGTKRWAFETQNYISSSPVLAPDGTVYFGGWDRVVYAVRGTAGLAESSWPKFRGGPVLAQFGAKLLPGPTPPPEPQSVAVVKPPEPAPAPPPVPLGAPKPRLADIPLPETRPPLPRREAAPEPVPAAKSPVRPPVVSPATPLPRALSPASGAGFGPSLPRTSKLVPKLEVEPLNPPPAPAPVPPPKPPVEIPAPKAAPVTVAPPPVPLTTPRAADSGKRLLIVNIIGQGQVQPPESDLMWVEVGRPLTLRAVAAAGHVFGGWSGSLTDTADTLIVRLQSNLVLHATFLPATAPAPLVVEPKPVVPAPAAVPVPAATLAQLNLTVIGAGRVAPNLAGVPLDVGRTYGLTAEPAKGFAFAGWTGTITTNTPSVQFTMQAGMALQANFTALPGPLPTRDTARPTVTITAPEEGARLRDPVVTLRGTAADKVAMERVEFRVGDGAFRPAEGTTNWLGRFLPVPGTNTLTVRAVDAAGNESALASRMIYQVQLSPLTISISGAGTVKPALAGTLLEVGRSYTLIAEPAKDYVFAGWMEGINTDNPKFTFIMQPDLVLQARFAPKSAASKPATFAVEPPAGATNAIVLRPAVPTVPPPSVMPPARKALPAEVFSAASAGATNLMLARPPVLEPAVQRPATKAGLAAPARTVRNPGLYNGLFYATNGLAPATSGYFSLAVTAGGGFTGRLTFGDTVQSFSGQFDEAGHALAAASRSGRTALTLALHLDPTNPSDTITGQVQDGAFTAQLQGDRQVFDGQARVSPLAGRYTMVIPGLTNATAGPGGDGFGTVVVDGSGGVKFSGELADGTLVKQEAFLSADGLWPLHLPLYGGKGALIGWITLTNRATPDLFGMVHWFKPAVKQDRFYPAGFSTRLYAFGSRYTPPTTEVKISTKLTGLLRGGNVGQLVMDNIAVGVGSQPAEDKGNEQFTLSLAPATGQLAGKFLDPGTRQWVDFRGVLLQRQNWGAGYFLGGPQSGLVFVRAQD